MSIKSKEEVLSLARSVIKQEMEALHHLHESLNDAFYEAAIKILNSSGKLIITGMGKSAIIGQKIVATFNSTGTTSVFMHAADAAHGDLGVITKDDILLILSKSGETEEIKALLPIIRSIAVHTIAVVGTEGSYLDREADISLVVPTLEEADPHNLAPTTSTTVQLALGDALAMVLLECRGFTRDQFASLHPGGNLGKKLLLKVLDLSARNEAPSVIGSSSLKDVIVEMTSKRLGVTAVINSEKRIIGIITDGDLRRMLNNHPNPAKTLAHEIMTCQPKTIKEDKKAVEALEMMRKNSISQLLVTNNNDQYCGVIHIHDLIREGLI